MNVVITSNDFVSAKATLKGYLKQLEIKQERFFVFTEGEKLHVTAEVGDNRFIGVIIPAEVKEKGTATIPTNMGRPDSQFINIKGEDKTEYLKLIKWVKLPSEMWRRRNLFKIFTAGSIVEGRFEGRAFICTISNDVFKAKHQQIVKFIDDLAYLELPYEFAMCGYKKITEEEVTSVYFKKALFRDGRELLMMSWNNSYVVYENQPRINTSFFSVENYPVIFRMELTPLRKIANTISLNSKIHIKGIGDKLMFNGRVFEGVCLALKGSKEDIEKIDFKVTAGRFNSAVLTHKGYKSSRFFHIAPSYVNISFDNGSFAVWDKHLLPFIVLKESENNTGEKQTGFIQAKAYQKKGTYLDELKRKDLYFKRRAKYKK